jgi:hypothetical protein
MASIMSVVRVVAGCPLEAGERTVSRRVRCLRIPLEEEGDWPLEERRDVAVFVIVGKSDL